MATRKEKHARALAKREKFMQQVKEDGLAALEASTRAYDLRVAEDLARRRRQAQIEKVDETIIGIYREAFLRLVMGSTEGSHMPPWANLIVDHRTDFPVPVSIRESPND